MERYAITGDLYIDGIPQGLNASLARNLAACQRFSALSDSQRAQLIEQTHGIRSADEMRAFVDNYQNWSFQ